MKPRVLALAEVYLPGYLSGGPVRSLANMIEHLGDDFAWLVVTTDRDWRAPAPYSCVTTDSWQRVGKADVYYATPKTLEPFNLARFLRTVPFDLLYLNSFFNPTFSLLPIFARWVGQLPCRRVLLAPHGEFSAGALEIKAWKKGPFAALARRAGAYRDVVWHASTELEQDDVIRVMAPPRSRIHVARDLTVPRPSVAAVNPGRNREGPLRVCFLSRISRMKNLDYALKVLQSIRHAVEFTVYGPIEDSGYWAECDALCRDMPGNVRVTYEGAVPHERVRNVLAKHDLFFLPSRGENFGHVLVEAWSSGLIALISDQTPWRGLATQGVGWDLPLNNDDAFVAALNEVASWTPAKWASARASALAYADRHARQEATVDANREMLRQALA